MLPVSFLSFLNSQGPDVNTLDKGLAQDESATGRLLLCHANKIIESHMQNMSTTALKVKTKSLLVP